MSEIRYTSNGKGTYIYVGSHPKMGVLSKPRKLPKKEMDSFSRIRKMLNK